MAAEYDEVSKCRRALASLRCLKYGEDTAIIELARKDLERAEQLARSTLRPEDVLRASLDRLQSKE